MHFAAYKKSYKKCAIECSISSEHITKKYHDE